MLLEDPTVRLSDRINGMEAKEDNDHFKNGVDYMFLGLAKRKPGCFSVRQYQKYKLSCGVICSKRLIYQTVQTADR
jgi:type IV secretion system protein VirD4